MRIIFQDNELELHPSGILLWPAEKLLIVSDIHLEKSSYFARRGFFLPPYESQSDLQKLHDILIDTRMERVMILGDCFHDDHGYKRLNSKARALFESLMKFKPIWIRGNHDSKFSYAEMLVHNDYKIGNLIFRHEAEAGSKAEISGHYHPKATLEHKGGIITRPCFIVDQSKMILPSFGALTGGLDINHPVIARHFSGTKDIYLTGGKKIYAFGT